MFSDFPNLHPLVVHFPIVLILLSVLLQAILVFRDYNQIRWGALAVMGAAFVGAVLASYVFHAHAGELSPKATAVFERHEKFAFYTVWLSGLTFLLQGISIFYKLYQRSFQIIVFISALVSAIFLSIAGHQGAQLVYVEGVGPQGRNLMKGHSHDGMEDGHEGMDMKPGDTAYNMDMDHHRDMKMDSGKAMPGMDHSKMPKTGTSMEGMDHSKMDMPSGNNKMTGMDHSKMNMPKSAGSSSKGMSGMDHSKMDMPKSSSSKPMEGMDHSKMDMGTGKTNSTSMPGMNHGNIYMKSGNTSGMQDMDHGNMSGMGNMSQGPLIDASKLYDNNPAQEEKRVKQKN